MQRVEIPEVARILDSPKSADIMAFLKSDVADPKTAEFSSLTVDGDTAKAKITKRFKDGTETTGYSLHKVGNAWLVDP